MNSAHRSVVGPQPHPSQPHHLNTSNRLAVRRLRLRHKRRSMRQFGLSCSPIMSSSKLYRRRCSRMSLGHSTSSYSLRKDRTF
ncbi:hypothetical protein CABS02_00916 [Colletotrichum abscissum]|uniref:Uncharacterized protein n=1 Tax=Colletotrichum abscissum TaxID=1671311 RepID=A0A9P9XSF4_9PEZI|nr:hypothetical protein CABS02_00916 [Colletotrichum abscissum]